jgi:hypothetical protein
MKRLFRIIIPVLVIISVLAFGIPAMAATSSDVTITATPIYIAMTLTDGGTNTWAIGNAATSTTYWWTTDGNAPSPEPFEAADMKATITNTGSVAEDFDIHGHAFTGGVGWAITGAGVDAVTLKAGITGTANAAAMISVGTTDTELADNISSSGTTKMCMSLLTGTFTDGVAKSGTVTVTARAHS